MNKCPYNYDLVCDECPDRLSCHGHPSSETISFTELYKQRFWRGEKMRKMYLTFEDEEAEFLDKARTKSKARSWEKFIMELAKKGDEE